MLKYYIQLVSVLGMVIFLAAGCASPVDRPYDFKAMWTLEEQLRLQPSLTPGGRHYTVARHSQIDHAYSYYYAGQVALANGDPDKADRFFAKSIALVNAFKEEYKAFLRENTGFLPEQAL